MIEVGECGLRGVVITSPMIRMAARTGLSGNLPVYAFAGGDFCAFLRMTIETEVGLERLQRLVTAAALSFELNMRGKNSQACT